MSYDLAEALWLTRVRAMTEFDSSNSGRATTSMLHTGKGAEYAVLYPGEHAHQRLGLGGSQVNTYRTRIQLWKPLEPAGDGSAAQELAALAEDVRQELDKYRLLGDTTNSISHARIVTTGAMEQRRLVKDGMLWLMVELVGECHYEESITFAE